METYEDGNMNQGYNDNNAYDTGMSGYKTHNPTERGGLIPVTAKILELAEVTKSETVEFQGVQILDITAVGFVVDYKESEAKIKISLFDCSGVIDINFFNSNLESGLTNFQYDGSRKPVQIFGTVKIYKNEKNIQGSKLIEVTSNDVFYHKMTVVHSWLYLTGLLEELNAKNMNNTASEAKKLAGDYNNNINRSFIQGQQNNIIVEAYRLLSQFSTKNGNQNINIQQLKFILKKFGNNIDKIIKDLVDQNKIIENNGEYEII